MNWYFLLSWTWNQRGPNHFQFHYTTKNRSPSAHLWIMIPRCLPVVPQLKAPLELKQSWSQAGLSPNRQPLPSAWCSVPRGAFWDVLLAVLWPTEYASSCSRDLSQTICVLLLLSGVDRAQSSYQNWKQEMKVDRFARQDKIHTKCVCICVWAFFFRVCQR